MCLNRFRGHGLAAAFLAAFASTAIGQSIGPDVIVGEVTGVSNYAAVGGINAYAVGTTSCNKGNQTLSWIASTNQHPVIGQNVFRIRNGRFEQVGQAHLKHGFTALQGTACFTNCQPNPNGSALGLNCSDPYSSSLNGQQSGLGPKFEVNAATGFYPYPFTSNPYSGTIARRLQIASVDVDPAQNAGAIFLAEGQYIHPVDAQFGNDNNNASYRTCTFAAGSFAMTLTGSTVREKPAIVGWRDFDPSVTLNTIDIPLDGRMILALKTQPEAGTTRYNYALHNLNSDRSAHAVRFMMPAGTTVSGLEFHDVPYHSGEPFDGTDWGMTWNGAEAAFVCNSTHAQNPNANALRWGTTYTFSFLSDSAPTGVQIDLFKPGSPGFVVVGPTFTLDMSTTGGATGDFHLGVDNIPANSLEGFCLFSLATSLPLGTGSFLGIVPDYLTLISLLDPALPGNFLHWTWPVAAPLFPAADFNLPPGALPFVAGTKVDGVCVVLGAGYALNGVTAPVRATF